MGTKFEVVRVRGDEYGILCPWHTDKSPSLYINLTTDKAHCFAGCFKGTAKDAIKKLLGRVPNKLSDAFEFHSTPFVWRPSVEGGTDWDGKAYLYSRGFTDSTIWSWEIGYNKGRRVITIPIRKRDGRLVGTISRHVDPGVQPKYIYSTGLKVSTLLFGTHKFEPFPSPVVYVVEGSLDCIWMWQCGFRSTVALLGLNLSPVQEKILQRLGSTIVLALDNDSPGQGAISTIASKLARSGQDVYVLPLLEGRKDVQEHSPSELHEVVSNKIPFLSWQLLTSK